MDYRALETLYGPDIRFNDWRAEAGEKVRAAGGLLMLAHPEGVLVRDDYPYGGGGDVAHHLRFAVERLEPDGKIVVHFNHRPRDAKQRGIAAFLEQGAVRVSVAGAEVADRTLSLAARGEEHDLAVATLYESYALWFDDSLVARGSLPAPATDNEGWVKLTGRSVDFRVIEYREDAIVHDLEFPRWRRQKLIKWLLMHKQE